MKILPPTMKCMDLQLLVVLLLHLDGAWCADKDETYRGKYLGKINSYHHQTSGEVHAVDQWTLLITNFNYDGNGADTFFWAGASNRPGPQGFIVADEHGRTNVLPRYLNKDFTLTLPDKKKITDIKWFAVYDLSGQSTFGDVYIPEEFEPPTVQTISQIGGRSHGVKSLSIQVLDSKTILLPEFSYNGKGLDTFFWAGQGPQPSSKGVKLPDEYGYLDPLRAYNGEDVMLQMPGDKTIFDIDWLSVFDVESKQNFGSVIIPDSLNVPPSLVQIVPHTNAFPNCHQLHKDLQVSWDYFGPQITIQLTGQVAEDEYMAFGLSGSTERSQMLNADAAIAYMDGYLGYATDYNITAKAPCVKVLGAYRGVCRDDLVGGADSNQLHTATRENGINTITYRRTLISSDSGDKEYPAEGWSYIIWAIGKLDRNKDPVFHHIYPKGNLRLQLSRKPESSCFPFTQTKEVVREPWSAAKLFDKTARSFTAVLGPSGGKRGYRGITGMTSPGLSWYINGRIAPEIWLRRGTTYGFRVRGGNNPHSAANYHPLIITDEPHGGFDRLSDEAQRSVRVLAGVEFTRRGRPKPTAAGPLCIGEHDSSNDRRLDDDFPTFNKFNKSLVYKCESGPGALLEVTPNSSWPDLVYYNSFTHSNMGWKIHIIDSYKEARSSAFTANHLSGLVLSFVCTLLFVR